MVTNLREHFATLEGYGEVQATSLVREQTGELTVRDRQDDAIYLPPVMAKRYCYRRYCADNGYNVITNKKGNKILVKKKEEDFIMEGGGEYKDFVSHGPATTIFGMTIT